jgi:hypothetical protein
MLARQRAGYQRAGYLPDQPAIAGDLGNGRLFV